MLKLNDRHLMSTPVSMFSNVRRLEDHRLQRQLLLPRAVRVAVVLDVEVADALEELADVVVELVRVIPVPFQDADVVLDDRVVRELTERERRT